MSAVLEKKYFDSAEMMVIFLSEFFLICLAAVTPEIPLPIITICSMVDRCCYSVGSKVKNLIINV